MFNRSTGTFYARKLNLVCYLGRNLDIFYARKLKFGMLLKPLTLCLFNKPMGHALVWVLGSKCITCQT